MYININLTKYKRHLYKKTRTAAKEKGYSFLWLNNDADILVCKDSNSNVKKISSETDIFSLKLFE